MPKSLLAFGLVALIVPAFASAQLVTDRPDFTESALAVPRGQIQVELGSTLAREAGAHRFSGAEALIRWGVNDAMELRLVLPDYVAESGSSGLTDGAIGTKVELGRARSWDLAALATLGLRTGDSDYGSDGTSGNLILVAGRELGPSWSFATQVSGTWYRGAGDRELATSVVLGTGLSGRVSSFIEMAATHVEGHASEVLLHHGYVVALGPVLQLDVHTAVGVTEASRDALFGVGLSTRFGGRAGRD